MLASFMASCQTVPHEVRGAHVITHTNMLTPHGDHWDNTGWSPNPGMANITARSITLSFDGEIYLKATLDEFYGEMVGNKKSPIEWDGYAMTYVNDIGQATFVFGTLKDGTRVLINLSEKAFYVHMLKLDGALRRFGSVRNQR